MGSDIGYLPGTATEKLQPWMKPIFDNLEFLVKKKHISIAATNPFSILEDFEEDDEEELLEPENIVPMVKSRERKGSGGSGQQQKHQIKSTIDQKRKFQNFKKMDSKRVDPTTFTFDQLQERIEIEPLGRSLIDTFFIVDESQNLTPHEIKTIISRAGKNTKIVLTGDIHQIDNIYVDAESCGLGWATERVKGKTDLCASVRLVKGERSELAEIAALFL